MRWTEYMDWIEVVRFKQISTGDNIVVYGYTPEQSQKVAYLFLKAGHGQVSVYNGFVDEFTAGNDLPMEKLKRYSHLVYPEWINTIVGGGLPPEHGGGKTVICHSHYRNREAYLSGHIPEAIDIDTLALEAPETWNRRSPEELKSALEMHGIDANTTVILYGKYMDPDNDDEFPGSAAGHIGAIRCAFIMMCAGVKDVRILNGGFQSWIDAGYEISSTDVPKIPVTTFGADIPVNPHLAFYCGTGWRGSEAWINAWLMGWPRVSVFDGGWFEWSSDPNNPFLTGIPNS